MKRQANRCAIKSHLLTGKIRHRPTIRIRLFCQFEPIPTARTWTINLNQLMYSIRSDTDNSHMIVTHGWRLEATGHPGDRYDWRSPVTTGAHRSAVRRGRRRQLQSTGSESA